MDPSTTLRDFDTFLAERGMRFEAVVIGGAALGLLGVISRPTKDCDVLAPPLSAELRAAAVAFARSYRARGLELADDWLNNGPSSLADVLPSTWRDELEPLFDGQALVLRTLGRLDLLRSKLFALCDRALDLSDCVAMRPTPTELAQVRPWLEEQDANEQWPQHVANVLADLERRLSREMSRGL